MAAAVPGRRALARRSPAACRGPARGWSRSARRWPSRCSRRWSGWSGCSASRRHRRRRRRCSACWSRSPSSLWLLAGARPQPRARIAVAPLAVVIVASARLDLVGAAHPSRSERRPRRGPLRAAGAWQPWSTAALAQLRAPTAGRCSSTSPPPGASPASINKRTTLADADVLADSAPTTCCCCAPTGPAATPRSPRRSRGSAAAACRSTCFYAPGSAGAAAPVGDA